MGLEMNSISASIWLYEIIVMNSCSEQNMLLLTFKITSSGNNYPSGGKTYS